MRLGKNAIIVLSFGGGMFLWIAAARTQSTRSASEAPPAFHREQPDDPPGQAAKDNPYARSPAARAQRGPFVSIQVNVDELGNNIVGDAANEPSIAIDPNDPDKIAIGWRQFDTIDSNFRQAGWGYSQDGGQSWIFPGVIEPGVFRSDPVLAFNGNGHFYDYSLTTDFGDVWECHLFKSVNGGVSWNEGVFAFGGDKAWLAVDRTGGTGHGHIYAKWQTFFNCCGEDTFTRSIDGASSFEDPVPVPLGPSFGVINVGPDGAVYVAGIWAVNFQDFDRIVIARSTDAQNPAVTPMFDLAADVELGGSLDIGAAPNPAGLAGQVWVATDHSGGPTHGNVYMLASVDPPGSDPLDVKFIRSTDGGQTWSPPLKINDDPPGTNAWQWFGTMSVAPNGRIDVVWNDTRNSGAANLSELFYSFSTDGGLTWADNMPVSPMFDSHLGWPNQNKIGDYYDMISDSFGSSVAYAATFNGEQDVYFLRIDLNDCNNNGIDDDQDIAEGSSADCNGNGVPDECEDCNENGQADSCDIDDGTSEDCNGNGVPDECEDFDVTVVFFEQIISTQADRPVSVFAADLDGDGDTDVLSASQIDDKIAWYENTDGLGSFGPQQIISTEADNAFSVFAADLDGDGDNDVLSASPSDDKIAWYENTDGLGSFGPQQIISTAADLARSVFAADLDGDGDNDVLSASFLDDKIAWYENTDGLGTFGPQQIISTAADNAFSVFAADLDGDGDNDVLSASFSDDKIAWYENTDGLGSFGPQQIISTAADGARSVFAADLDGDGDSDVLSASVGDDKIAWYENTDGLGTFGPQQIISTAAHTPVSVFAADLDGDGDNDVLSASSSDDKIAWYENTDGLGSYGLQQIISSAADGAHSVFAADVDGDGVTDVLSASIVDDKIAWYENLSDDCNGNDIPDGCDLADGTSQDCNGNAVPDECDIAGGASDDTNGDGIPDECIVMLELDIKPGSCPNPLNRHGNGVLPVALVGTGDFDPTEVDLSTLQLSRADGVGGSVAPNEGPPGPHSVFEDVASPFEGEACVCHDLGGDGVDDLSMKFRTDEMVEALELDALPGGAVVELMLSGSLLDGTPFLASDCVVIVPPGDMSPANAHVQSNVADTFVEVAPLDLNFDDDGFADFARSYYTGTAMTLTAPPQSAGRRFVRWLIDGAPQPIGMRTIEITVSDDTTLKAAYAHPARATPEHPTESDAPLE